MRRRATLPHPLECSTIAVPGLSFRVRKGTGRLTWAMTTAKPIRYGRPEKPAAGNGTNHDSGRGGPGTGQRTRAINALPASSLRPQETAFLAIQRENHHRTRPDPQGSERVCRVRPLVPVGSIPRGTSTSGLSNTCSTCGLQTPKCQGILILEQASRLDAFSGYPSRT